MNAKQSAFDKRREELTAEIQTAEADADTATQAHEAAVRSHAMQADAKNVQKCRLKVVEIKTTLEDLRDSLNILDRSITDHRPQVSTARAEFHRAERLALAEVRDQMIEAVRETALPLLLQAWGAHQIAGGYHTKDPAQWLRENVFQFPGRGVDGFDYQPLIYPPDPTPAGRFKKAA
jgi:hypothetical protein